MGKFIIYLYRIVNYYLYFVIMACFFAIVPNINPNYPLFNAIFKAAGFYLVPPIFGFVISPMIVMVVLALIMMGLSKIYVKYFESKEPKVIVMSTEDFMKEIIKNQQNAANDNTQETDDKHSESEENKQ